MAGSEHWGTQQSTNVTARCPRYTSVFWQYQTKCQCALRCADIAEDEDAGQAAKKARGPLEQADPMEADAEEAAKIAGTASGPAAAVPGAHDSPASAKGASAAADGVIGTATAMCTAAAVLVTRCALHDPLAVLTVSCCNAACAGGDKPADEIREYRSDLEFLEDSFKMLITLLR